MCASLCGFSGPLNAHFDAHISHLGLGFGLGFYGGGVWGLLDGDGFGQVAGLVHVEALGLGQGVGEDLQRDHVDRGHE